VATLDAAAIRRVAARTSVSSTPLISQYREIGTSPNADTTGSKPAA
jgi:hypothetical protein